MTKDVSGTSPGLALEDLRTLAYAAAFIRTAAKSADSIEVVLPPLDHAAGALERVCELAVADGPLEAEIRFARRTTTVRLARPGRL